MDNTIDVTIRQFFSQFKRQTYHKGEIFIRADDQPLGIYYLIDGIAKEYSISLKGEESIITIFRPSSFFPMSWAINKTSNKYYFEAITDIEVWRAPEDQVLTFIKNNPDILFDLLRRVYKGIDGLTERMVYLMGGSAYDRVAVELIINAKRFGKKIAVGTHTLTLISLSEKDLAAQSGLTRETVSRELKILKEKKLVSYEKNKLIINDLKALEDELTIMN